MPKVDRRKRKSNTEDQDRPSAKKAILIPMEVGIKYQMKDLMHCIFILLFGPAIDNLFVSCCQDGMVSLVTCTTKFGKS